MNGKSRGPVKNLLLYGILVAATIYSLFPIVWVLLTSFKREADVYSADLQILPKVWTIENYVHVLTDDGYIFLTWMKNSLIVAAATTIVGVFLAATAAYAFSRFKFYGRKFGLYLFLLTQMFPGIILIVPLYAIIRNLGLLNTYTGLIIAYSTTGLPFCVWMLKGFFDTIPICLEEAARIDGLGPIGIFWRITLPLSLPGLAVTAFFTFITAWNEFMVALTFMNQKEMYLLPVGMRTFVSQFNSKEHLMAAAAMIVTLPLLFLFLKVQTYIISGQLSGAAKG